MKYTAIESGGFAEIKKVEGCTKCPHMESITADGKTFMRCTHNGKRKTLIGKWTGAYHESCQLPRAAKTFVSETAT